MALDPKSTAVLILDLQNDVIGPEGAFKDSGSPPRRARPAPPSSTCTTSPPWVPPMTPTRRRTRACGRAPGPSTP